MNASLVYDYADGIRVPPSMGVPSADQMQGTLAEQLGELASRICYDSLGNGRSSAKLHAHILEVINLSVYEHFNFTVQLEIIDAASIVANRKGIWIAINESGGAEITCNLRAILEWERWERPINKTRDANLIRDCLRGYGHRLAPQIVTINGDIILDSCLKNTWELTPDQAWITLYMSGSRGFTHEQVRHRFAMSQRSTRYVNESESDYIIHPIIKKFLSDYSVPINTRDDTERIIELSCSTDTETYITLVSRLEEYLILRGANKQTARKQARGAARGYLGNALTSEMLFSAPVTGWRWMLNQRASQFADAEIRQIYEYVLYALKSSQFARMFDDYNLIDSPDGLGKVIA